MHESDVKSVRVTLTLSREAYERVKEACRPMGLRPSTWMTMIVTSKVNDLELQFRMDNTA